MKNILEINNLKTYFRTDEGTTKAVDGVSYDVRKGECVAIVGESGCGKSVGALSILRLIPNPPGETVDGQIIFQGEDLLKHSEKEMEQIRGNRIAMIFQEASTSLNPSLSVYHQISEPLILHRNLDKKALFKEVVRILQLVKIPDVESRLRDYPHQFSGGTQQRIMIAMALSCNPDLLIADEPTTALDVTIQAQILEIIKEMSNSLGTSVILITHNLGIVAKYVDRVNVMYAGRIVEKAPTPILFSRPGHPYTKGLLASVPRLTQASNEKLIPVKGMPPDLQNLPAGCAFYPRCDDAMEDCAKSKPELVEIEEGHHVACFLKTRMK